MKNKKQGARVSDAPPRGRPGKQNSAPRTSKLRGPRRVASLHQATLLAAAGAIGANIRRLLLVADSDGDKKLSMRQLAKESRLGRTTLTRLCTLARAAESRHAGYIPNPDLLSLCTIAEQLGVSPAFLLMSDTDWKRIASAIKWTVSLSVNQNRLPDKTSFEKSAAQELALIAKEFAESANVLQSVPEKVNKEYNAALSAKENKVIIEKADADLTTRKEMRRKQARSVAMHSVLPPYNGASQELQHLLFLFSVQLGASHKPPSQL